MLALSMVVVAGLTGAAGLGAVVERAVTQLDVAAGFEGGLAVVLLAIFLDRLTGALGHQAALSRFRAARARRSRRHRETTPAEAPGPAPATVPSQALD